LKEIDSYPLPVFAVFDPDCGRWKEIMAALRDDHVELESHHFRKGDTSGTPTYRVRVASLGSDQLAKICRLFAREWGLTEQAVLVEAIYGAGITIPALGIFVCPDPDVGRRHYAGRREKEGRRD
jgi:hypothetical protein